MYSQLWTLRWPMNWLQALSAVIPDPRENPGLQNHPWMREPFWKSMSPVEKLQQKLGTKKKSKMGHIGEDKRNSPTWQSSAPREHFSAQQGKVRACEWAPSLSMQEPAKAAHFSLTLWEYWVVSCRTEGVWAAGRRAARAHEGTYLYVDPTNHSSDSIRIPIHKSLGTTCLWIPANDDIVPTVTPRALSASLTHIPTPHG